ncbi:MAG: sigma-54 interaction domain-containing protein [Chitinispirillaceae bacterium]
MDSSRFSQNEILGQIPCGIVVIGQNKKIVYANSPISKLTGLSSSKIPGSTLCSLGLKSTEEDRLITGQEWWEWAEGATIHMKTSLADAQGKRIPVFISARRTGSETGDQYLYLCILEVSQFEEWPAETYPRKTVRDSYHGLIGRTPRMQDLFELIQMASGTDVNVVILGESGTGKELVASAIHYSSSRKNEPYVRVNCAALSETLLESELFGHVKGAFTGAYKARAGTFEAAHGGTILLDEIGEISPAVQVKLLRVLQERIVMRVGDNREIPVDVRVIAATNRNLRQLIQKGKFREDLFYRLNVFPIHLTPLRERKPDIPLLCNHFLKKYREETGKNIISVSPDAMRLLMNYCWPGNVRELENAIEHAFVLSRTDEIQVSDLPHELRVRAVREGICAEKVAGIEPSVKPRSLIPRKSGGRLDISREQLAALLEEHKWNKSATARALGISKVALWKKMKKLGMM